MNKGEASEFYAFVYILGHKILNLVDQNLHRTGNKVSFSQLFRDGATYEFIDQNRIRIQSRGLTNYIDRADLKPYVESFFKAIDTLGKIPEDHHVLRQVMTLTASTSTKSKSSDKSDLQGTVKFPQIPFSQYLGFSIKSYIGHHPTVLNASGKNTRFVYRILHNGSDPTDSQIERLIHLYENCMSYAEFYRNIMSEGFLLVFKNTGSETLSYNLRLIDSRGPELVARLMYEQYAFPGRVTLETLVDSVAQKNDIPEIQMLGEAVQERTASLKYKIQSFLLAFTSGATAGHKWSGIDEASGGLLVVEKDGEVVCLELVTRNAIGKYLIQSSYFESPSGNRHPKNHLEVDPDTGEVTIDLQLQIRLQHP